MKKLNVLYYGFFIIFNLINASGSKKEGGLPFSEYLERFELYRSQILTQTQILTQKKESDKQFLSSSMTLQGKNNENNPKYVQNTFPMFSLRAYDNNNDSVIIEIKKIYNEIIYYLSRQMDVLLQDKRYTQEARELTLISNYFWCLKSNIFCPKYGEKILSSKDLIEAMRIKYEGVVDIIKGKVS